MVPHECGTSLRLSKDSLSMGPSLNNQNNCRSANRNRNNPTNRNNNIGFRCVQYSIIFFCQSPDIYGYRERVKD